ncbi:uncharacterized protein [Lolium perenne]|uniref:uncharacterized protein n=1 Tax=Lolium perenne TaxID=4522 RepID=UPI003A98D6DA
MAAKGWGKSKVTRESLLPYVASGVIPEFNQERWRVPPVNETEPLPRPGEFRRVQTLLRPWWRRSRLTLDRPRAKAPEVEEDIVEEGGLSEPLKECRSKAARDRAPPSDADTRTGEVPSTEAVMRADGATESRHPPPSSLTFTELHTALGEAHVAEIKRLTALVEEAAQKNRKLIALGSKSGPLAVLIQCHWPWRSFSPFPFLVAEAQAKALAEAREGFVKESFYREAEFRAQRAEEAEAAARRAGHCSWGCRVTAGGGGGL